MITFVSIWAANIIIFGIAWVKMTFFCIFDTYNCGAIDWLGLNLKK